MKFNFISPQSSIMAYCEIERRGNVVIATELADNPGANITSTAELLAAQIAAHFEIDPQRLVWIEHAEGTKEYSLVTFHVHYLKDDAWSGLFFDPEWKIINHKIALRYLTAGGG